MKLGMIDLSIIVIYLIMCLIIGFYRSTKIKTLKQFAVGYQNLSTTMLICIIFAVTVGGNTILGSTERLYLYGVAFLIGRLFTPIYWFLSAKVYGSNIERFRDCLSISQIMDKLYGPLGRWVTSISAITSCLGVVAVQALAMGYVVHYFFGIKTIYGMLISFSILTLYTAAGGIRAVVLTEAFQFSIFFFIIPVSYVIAMKDIGGMQSLMQKLPTSNWDVELTTKNIILIASLMFYPILPIPDSTLVQRYLIASGADQLKKSLITVAWISIPFVLSMSLIAYIVMAYAPDVPAKEAFLFYIDNYLPIGLKGLMVAGIMAAIMNVAEAWLNTSSVILVNDIIKVLFPTVSSKKQLLLLRISVVILTVISTIIAFFSDNIKDLILTVDNFWGPIILIPIVSGFLGFKTSGKSFAGSTIMAVIFTLTGRLIVGKFEIISLGLGILGSTIGLFGFHYYQIADKNIIRKRILLNKQSWKPAFIARNLVTLITSAIFKFVKKLLHNMLSQKAASYQKFATFTLVYYFTYTFFLNPDPAHKMLSYLLIVGYLLCFILLLRDIVFSRVFQDKYMFVYWYFTLTFCLPSVASYMLFASEGNNFWIINGLLTAFSLCLFVDVITFVILLSIGVCIGYGLFLLASLGNESLQVYNTLGNIGYIYLFFLFVFLIFFRDKEKEQEEKVEIMQMLGGAIAHEAKTPISGLMMSAQAINEIINRAMNKVKKQNRKKYTITFEKSEYSFLMQISQSIEKIGKQGITTVDSILTALKDSVVGDEKKFYLIKECIEQSITEYSIFNDNVRNIEVNIKSNFKVYCSSHYLRHVFFNLIKNAYKYGGPNVKIKIWTKGSTLYFKDYGKGVAKEDLSRIFERFYTKSKTGTGVGLAFCKMVMKDLGGTIKCKSKLGKYAEFILTFPRLDR